MKKFLYQAASVGLLCMVGVLNTNAQPAPPPAAPVPKTATIDNGDQSEIIIRQKGDKDTKITLEIKNGEYFINGKPLEKFDDQNVIVEKREISGDNDINIYSPSPFRINPWDEDRMDRDQRNKDEMARRIQKSVQIRMNSAFLGVSSRKSEKGGATVLEVTKGSPAEKAGIRKGDVITKVNDSKIESPESLFETIHNYKPGDKVKIIFTRDGKEQSVMATLEKSEFKQKDFNYNYNFKMPPMPDMYGMDMDSWGHKQPKLGIKAQDAEDGKGVNVLEVEDSSAAFKSGLKKGDIIIQFDGTEVNSTSELVDQMEEARHKPVIKVKILRAGVSQDIDIKIPRKLKTAEL
ncbi:MAG TPA: PDZ domain-containing protein [Puia sp.]|nr:PDZ domain-containing protein [Puia sp.]